MADQFLLPAVGDTMVEGTISTWLVAVGDTVKLDQPVCEVETDKSSVELTTPFAGQILGLGGEEGDTVAVGDMLLVIGSPGEEIQAPDPAPNPAPTPAPAPVSPQTPTTGQTGKVLSPVIRRLIDRHGLNPADVHGTGPGGRIIRSDVDRALASFDGSGQQIDRPFLAMPKVRKAIRDRGIDPSGLQGTGPNGSVTLADLAVSTDAPPTQGLRTKLTPTRKAIIANLTASVRDIPQFTTWWDVDATNFIEARSLASETLGRRVPWDAMFLLLMAPVFERHPLMTAAIDGDDLVMRPDLDVGVAVAAEAGLVVPVVRSADTLTLEQLCDAIGDLGAKAGSRSLSAHDLTGAVATLNNIGAIGATRSVSILPPGSTMILSPGRPVEQLRMGSNGPEAFSQLTLSGTFDHRVVDGGQACAFLADVAAVLEEPLRAIFR